MFQTRYICAASSVPRDSFAVTYSCSIPPHRSLLHLSPSISLRMHWVRHAHACRMHIWDKNIRRRLCFASMHGLGLLMSQELSHLLFTQARQVLNIRSRCSESLWQDNL